MERSKHDRSFDQTPPRRRETRSTRNKRKIDVDQLLNTSPIKRRKSRRLLDSVLAGSTSTPKRSSNSIRRKSKSKSSSGKLSNKSIGSLGDVSTKKDENDENDKNDSENEQKNQASRFTKPHKNSFTAKQIYQNYRDSLDFSKAERVTPKKPILPDVIYLNRSHRALNYKQGRDYYHLMDTYYIVDIELVLKPLAKCANDKMANDEQILDDKNIPIFSPVKTSSKNSSTTYRDNADNSHQNPIKSRSYIVPTNFQLLCDNLPYFRGLKNWFRHQKRNVDENNGENSNKITNNNIKTYTMHVDNPIYFCTYLKSITTSKLSICIDNCLKFLKIADFLNDRETCHEILKYIKKNISIPSEINENTVTHLLRDEPILEKFERIIDRYRDFDPLNIIMNWTVGGPGTSNLQSSSKETDKKLDNAMLNLSLKELNYRSWNSPYYVILAKDDNMRKKLFRSLVDICYYGRSKGLNSSATNIEYMIESIARYLKKDYKTDRAYIDALDALSSILVNEDRLEQEGNNKRINESVANESVSSNSQDNNQIFSDLNNSRESISSTPSSLNLFNRQNRKSYFSRQLRLQNIKATFKSCCREIQFMDLYLLMKDRLQYRMVYMCFLDCTLNYHVELIKLLKFSPTAYSQMVNSYNKLNENEDHQDGNSSPTVPENSTENLSQTNDSSLNLDGQVDQSNLSTFLRKEHVGKINKLNIGIINRDDIDTKSLEKYSKSVDSLIHFINHENSTHFFDMLTILCNMLNSIQENLMEENRLGAERERERNNEQGENGEVRAARVFPYPSFDSSFSDTFSNSVLTRYLGHNFNFIGEFGLNRGRKDPREVMTYTCLLIFGSDL